MRQLLIGALAMLLCATAAYSHDANADVMTIETRITLPEKEPIILTYRANHLGEGKTLERLVSGELGRPYAGGSIATPMTLTSGSAKVAVGKHDFFIGSEDGKMYMQIGGSAREGGGTRIPMTLRTVDRVLEHMQITVSHGDGDHDLRIMFAYGKYRSTVILTVG